MLKLSKTLLALAAFLPLSIYADTPATTGSSTMEYYDTMPSQGEIDYLNINMPGGADRMGLLGLHYDFNLLPIPNFYTGIGTYGAVTGDNGGFFALGIDNNYRPRIYKSLYLDSGIFVGGGGARSSQVGGGLMLLPHLGLAYQVGGELVSLDYSYAKFPTGQIASSQVMLGVIFPSDFNFFSPESNAYSGSNDAINWQADRLYLSPIAQIYRPKNGTTSLQGESQDGTMDLLGAEGGKFITDRLYIALRASAVGKGNANGYMAVLGGLGYQYPLTQKFYWVTDALAGSGGGGEVNTGNGILLEADTGFGWQITPSLQPRLLVGYLDAPDGNFQTGIASLALNYDLGWLSAPTGEDINYVAPSSDLQHWRMEAYNQTFFDPQRTSSSNTGNINLIGGSLEQMLSPSWYLSYRASFAYQGQNSGGLAMGLLGAGYQLNFDDAESLHPHIALLGGAAGGGGLDVGGGFLIEPEIGLLYDITPKFGIDVSGGHLMSVTSGSFHTNVLNAGLTFSFGKLTTN